MSKNENIKSLFEKNLENPDFRGKHEESSAAFRLEVQLLRAMENKGWNYTDLATATHTSKSNVSRDLKAGGLFNASFSRINRMADALGMKLVALLIPKDQAREVLPKIEELVHWAMNTASGRAVVHQPTMVISRPIVYFSPSSERMEQNFTLTFGASYLADQGVKK